MKNQFESDNGILKAIGTAVVVFITFIIGFVYGAFSYGFVGMELWSWFISPVFGLPELSWGQAYGIVLVSSIFTYRPHYNTNKDEREKHEKIGQLIASLILPWIILFSGWVCKTFFI